MAGWEWFLFGFGLGVIMSGVTWRIIFWFIENSREGRDGTTSLHR